MTYVGAVTEADQTTILVVDDHPLFREALFQVVKEAFTGYRVVDLPDWDSTVNWLREDDSVELVLMDLNMPGVTGFSGLTTLRQDQPALPVVIISSTEDRAVASQALSLGAAGFLPKSLPRAALTEALNRIMDGEVVAPEGLYGDGAEDG
ncbi:MAG: response regulator, partial [Rhodospirillaceae bacterium]